MAPDKVDRDKQTVKVIGAFGKVARRIGRLDTAIDGFLAEAQGLLEAHPSNHDVVNLFKSMMAATSRRLAAFEHTIPLPSMVALIKNRIAVSDQGSQP